jgi:hypothetical protein
MVDPVVASDGHSYDRDSLERWLDTDSANLPVSPLTNLPLEDSRLVPNYALRAAIDEWREAHPDAARVAAAEARIDAADEASDVRRRRTLDAVRKALCSALEACQVMPPFATERGALLALNAAMSHAELVGLDDDNMIEIARDELVYRGFQQGERPPIDGEEAARNDARRTSALLAEIARFQTQVDVAGRANRAIVARAEAQIASRHEMEEQLALVFTRVEEARVEEARRRAEMHLSNIEQQAASAAEAGRQAVLRVQHGVQSHARLVARRAEPRCMVGIADLAGLAARVRRLGLED